MYVDGYGSLSESGLCEFRELCQVSFLVVGSGWVDERIGLGLYESG